MRIGARALHFVILLAGGGVLGAPPPAAIKISLPGNGAPILSWASRVATFSTVSSGIFGSLVVRRSDESLQPVLLDSAWFDFRRDEYVLTLREGLSFSSGRAPDSTDLEYSLVRGLLSSQPNLFREYLGDILGVKGWPQGSGPFRSGLVPGIRSEGRRSVRLKSRVFNPEFLSRFSYSLFSLVPREELRSDHVSWKSLPIGAGNFNALEMGDEHVLLQERGGQRILIETKRDEENAEIVFGRIPLHPHKYRRILLGTVAETAGVYFNPLSDLGASPCFRRLILTACQRVGRFIDPSDESLSKLDSFLPSGLFGKSVRESARVPDALCKLPSTLQQRKLVIPVRGAIGDIATFEKFRLELEKLGVSVKIQQISKKYWNANDRDTPCLISTLAVDDSDPLLEFAVLLPNSPFAPFIPSLDSDVTRLHSEIEDSQDYRHRLNRIKRLDTLVVDRLHFIPLFQRTKQLFVRLDCHIDVVSSHSGLGLDLNNIKMASCGINK